MESLQQERDRRDELSEELTHVVTSKVELELWRTGGGHTALRLELEDGRYMLITANDGAEVPEWDAPLMVGWYNRDADEAYYLLEFADDDRLLKFADWAPGMFVSGNPAAFSTWGRALSVSEATVHAYPNANERFWAPA